VNSKQDELSAVLVLIIFAWRHSVLLIKHLLVSKHVFKSCVESVSVCYNVDNYSDHDRAAAVAC